MADKPFSLLAALTPLTHLQTSWVGCRPSRGGHRLHRHHGSTALQRQEGQSNTACSYKALDPTDRSSVGHLNVRSAHVASRSLLHVSMAFTGVTRQTRRLPSVQSIMRNSAGVQNKTYNIKKVYLVIKLWFG